MFGEFGQKGNGAAEIDFEGEIIARVDANFRKILEVAFVVSLRVFQEIKHLRVFRRPIRVGREETFIGKNEIMRGDGHAI